MDEYFIVLVYHIYLVTSWAFGFHHFLAIMNSAAVTIPVHVFVSVLMPVPHYLAMAL